MSQAVWEGHKTYRVRGVGIAAVAVVALAAVGNVVYPAMLWAIWKGVDAAVVAADLDGAIALEDLTTVVSLATTLAQLTALTLTIIWLWRARKNLDAFPDTQPVLSPGWAIGGWFMPFANAVIPARLAANVARQSSRERWVSALTVVWWLALVVTYAVDRVASTVFDNQPETGADLDALADQYQTFAAAETVAGIAAVVAATAFAVFVPRVSAAQEDRIHRGWYEAQNRNLPIDPSPAIGG
ncbi:DUF4328 domain-containing protein [Asanoa sp. NPDC049573]|uniref:DUF4328 domain-containing protein n=1 Tax=Asanoa sp. NPDC049573 TaxID=3155396 RepID=UPI0034358157